VNASGLIEVVHWLEDVFDRLSLRRSYGGAIAYNYHGPPRLTQDVDVLALVPDTKIPLLVDEFVVSGSQYGDMDPRPPVLREVLDDLRSKSHLATFLCRGVRVEIFVPWHSFHHRVLDRSPERDLLGRQIRIHAAEDLIVFKKIFDRPKDIIDIKAMLLAQKGRLDLARLRSDARGLLTDDSYAELETLVAEFA